MALQDLADGRRKTAAPDVSASDRSAALPLIVDLDGTLALGDSLHDALAVLATRRKRDIIAALASLALGGRVAFKQHLADLWAYPTDTLPLRPEFVAWLEEEFAAGREIHLVTASPQAVADAIALRLHPIFASATGTTGAVNLKGRAKAEHLKARFPDGFVYAGNDSSDLHIWEAASGVVTVATAADVRASAHALGKPVERDFPAKAIAWKSWLKLVRLHQWSKNGLMLVPLVLAHQYTNTEAVLAVVLGMLCMGLVASATYIVNDLGDLESDRRHSTKCRRPIASGAIPAKPAVLCAAALGLTGLAGALVLSPLFAALVLVYVAFTVSYSLKLKTYALIDVFVLGMLYMVRVYMGTVLTGAAASPWLLVFSLFFFLSLSLAKRHVEIVKAGERGHVGIIHGRGYDVRDAPLTLALGVSSSLAAVLLIQLYVVNDAFPVGLYNQPGWLWVIGPVVFLWASRVWLKSHRGELHDDPVVFAIKDPPSWVLGLTILATFILAVN
ncbi:MAG: UbiA family prenyltransferase [Rhizobiaceae bacterium]|jgi:4-hydroxybenzoate polyprenyltransferase|nr:UbiA family prenyltransferase [Rhizobiaceae bacterium]